MRSQAAAAASECLSLRGNEVLVCISALETKALVSEVHTRAVVSEDRAPDVLKHPDAVQSVHTFSGHLVLDCRVPMHRHRVVFALKVHAADLGALWTDAYLGNLSLSL